MDVSSFTHYMSYRTAEASLVKFQPSVFVRVSQPNGNCDFNSDSHFRMPCSLYYSNTSISILIYILTSSLNCSITEVHRQIFAEGKVCFNYNCLFRELFSYQSV